MDAKNVVGYFRGKNILITGSTGFLAKVLVEKILRVQPDVNKLFLLIRATDVESAKLRIRNEVIGKEIFQVLKENLGTRFDDFIQKKICPLAGDMMQENLGLDMTKLTEISKEIDIIINGAATTKFYERYDVSFNVNVMGVKHICAFAKKCNQLKMLLHISTAFVAAEQEGLILEKRFLMGQSLRDGLHLDIESEVNVIKKNTKELNDNFSSATTWKRTMKELGLKRARQFGWPNTYVFTKAMGEMLLGHLRGDLPVVIVRPSIITSIMKDPLPGWIEGVRTIDSVLLGYAKQTMTFFLANPNTIMDVIPVDMVVNAMMVAMAAHSEEKAETIYHLTSSLNNLASYELLAEVIYQYFLDNPPYNAKSGEPIRLSKMGLFNTMDRFRVHMTIKYKINLEIFRLVNIALCGVFSRQYNKLSRKYSFVMHLAELYAPYTLSKGCFDSTNRESLNMATWTNDKAEYYFEFDPASVDWHDYFYRVHIPGVIKYLGD